MGEPRRPRLGVCLLALGLSSLAAAYTYEPGPVPKSTRAPCPGRYCGRGPLNETHVGSCGRCERGWRVENNTHSLCRRCRDAPDTYDWLFLAFHAGFVLALHWSSVDRSAMRRSFTAGVLALHLLALLEVALAALATLLLFEPVGSLEVASCRTERLSDWYSYFHNPQPNYGETLYCTQEVVYPLYTMVFVFHGLCAAFMMLLRPCLTPKLMGGPGGGARRRGRSAIYAALYFLPCLALLHAIFGGLIYMAYPYIALVLSLISSATHFAYKLDQTACSLITECFSDCRNFVILLGHWVMHAFGILAITQVRNPLQDLCLLLLVPLPSIFYVTTVRFTDPMNFSGDIN